MPDETKVFILPEKFAFDEDTALRVFLREQAECAIVIDAKNMQKTDSLFLQYLIAASRAWQKNHLGFQVINMPINTADDLAILGITTEILSWKVAA